MKPPLSQICSVSEAAAILKVSEERVLQFARAGRIAGRKLKRDWVLVLASVKSFGRKPRPPGPKSKSS